MDLLTMVQLDGQGFFEDAEENPQLAGADPPSWPASAAARDAAGKAKQLKDAADYGGAAEQYAIALRGGHPNMAACYGKRADCLGRIGRLEEALADFSMATRLMPSSGAHLYGKAYTLKLLGRTEEAAKTAADAVSCNHEPAQALLTQLLETLSAGNAAAAPAPCATADAPTAVARPAEEESRFLPADESVEEENGGWTRDSSLLLASLSGGASKEFTRAVSLESLEGPPA